MSEQIADAIVIGAGAAGLSAAVYLARFLRTTVVIDGGGGRMAGPQLNENYLGFPKGIRADELLRRGRRQAERFGARFVDGTVATITRDEKQFVLSGECGHWRARTMILATGVTDIWPAVADVQRYVGRSLFWCITCDGFRTRGKRTVLVGADEASVTTALQFLVYTRDLVFIATGPGGSTEIAPEQLQLLRDKGIDVVEGSLERLEGARGQIRRVHAGGQAYETQLLFSLLGQVPNATLAAQCGVCVTEGGYVCVDSDQRTNVPRLFAAGDVTGPYAHQVTSAVHGGAMAAQAANYALYADFQQE